MHCCWSLWFIHPLSPSCCFLVTQSCPTLCHPMDCSPPWDSPGRNSSVSCHFLLQGILLTEGWKLHLLRWRRFFFSSSPSLQHLLKPGSDNANDLTNIALFKRFSLSLFFFLLSVCNVPINLCPPLRPPITRYFLLWPPLKVLTVPQPPGGTSRLFAFAQAVPQPWTLLSLNSMGQNPLVTFIMQINEASWERTWWAWSLPAPAFPCHPLKSLAPLSMS